MYSEHRSHIHQLHNIIINVTRDTIIDAFIRPQYGVHPLLGLLEDVLHALVNLLIRHQVDGLHVGVGYGLLHMTVELGLLLLQQVEQHPLQFKDVHKQLILGDIFVQVLKPTYLSHDLVLTTMQNIGGLESILLPDTSVQFANALLDQSHNTLLDDLLAISERYDMLLPTECFLLAVADNLDAIEGPRKYLGKKHMPDEDLNILFEEYDLWRITQSQQEYTGMLNLDEWYQEAFIIVFGVDFLYE